MTKISWALVFGLISAVAHADETKYHSDYSDLIVPETYSMFKEGAFDQPSFNNNQSIGLDYHSFDSDSERNYTDYWSDWVFKPDTNPFLSQNYSGHYFGIGFWSPTEYEGEDWMTTQEWLLDHGVQFSVGFGEKKYGEPRLRLDYMWHDEQHDNVLMQVEVPF